MNLLLIVLASAVAGVFPADNTDVKVIDTATETARLVDFQRFVDALEIEEQVESGVALSGSLSPMTDPTVTPLLAALSDDIIDDIDTDPVAIDPNLDVVTRADPATPIALADLLTPAEIALILSRDPAPPEPPPVEPPQQQQQQNGPPQASAPPQTP